MDTILVKEGSQFIPWIVRSKIVLVFLLDVSRQLQMNIRCLTKVGKNTYIKPEKNKELSIQYCTWTA